jgi:hypothetical protein
MLFWNFPELVFLDKHPPSFPCGNFQSSFCNIMFSDVLVSQSVYLHVWALNPVRFIKTGSFQLALGV